MLPSTVYEEVAVAVGLHEGEAGVRAIVRAVARLEPVAVKEVSRATGLPVPVVAAACNELRTRGVISHARPVRLTDEARAQLPRPTPPDLGTCPTCDGLGMAVPAELASLPAQLAERHDDAPPARVDLDQAHCTPMTQALRALLLGDLGALDGASVLLVGDDDFTSVGVLHLVRELGLAGPSELVVVDVDPAIVAALGEAMADAPFAFRAVEHDLRQPLPDELLERFDLAVTDPPYTSAGAALFLSRVASALRPGAGRDVLFAFGSPVPRVIADTQRTVLEIGFVVQRIVPRFNEYVGAGVLGGTSTMYHLRTVGDLAPTIVGSFEGDLYTGDRTRAARSYTCTTCGAAYVVGPDRPWATVGDLKASGCRECGGDRFRPGQRVAAPEPVGDAEV